MSKCNWDPAKHGGRECPIHGAGGSMWDENILTKQDKINKLKEKGYTEDEIEEELKGVGFDDDFEFDDDYERSWGPIIDEEDEAEIDEMIGSEEYAYGGLKSKEDLVNALVNRGKIDENTAKAYVTKHWDEYNKYFNNENNDEKQESDNNALKILKSVLTEEEWDAIKDNKNYIDGYLKGKYIPRELKNAARIQISEKSNNNETASNDKIEQEAVSAFKSLLDDNNKKIEKLNAFLEANKEYPVMAKHIADKIKELEKENNYYNSVIKNPKLIYRQDKEELPF